MGEGKIWGNTQCSPLSCSKLICAFDDEPCESIADIKEQLAEKDAKIESLKKDVEHQAFEIAAYHRDERRSHTTTGLVLKSHLDMAHARLAEKDAMIAQLLNVLPDSTHEEDETWDWCWDALSSDAQDLVKSARHAALREEE